MALSQPPSSSTSSYPALESTFRQHAQSPWPIWSLSALFFASSVLPASPANPPIMMRLGFSAVFGGAGYVLSAGDVRNGSGIATAWSLAYLVLNARRSFKRPLAFGPLGLTTAALASSALYGAEYFLLQGEDERKREP